MPGRHARSIRVAPAEQCRGLDDGRMIVKPVPLEDLGDVVVRIREGERVSDILPGIGAPALAQLGCRRPIAPTVPPAHDDECAVDVLGRRSLDRDGLADRVGDDELASGGRYLAARLRHRLPSKRGLFGGICLIRHGLIALYQRSGRFLAVLDDGWEVRLSQSVT